MSSNRPSRSSALHFVIIFGIVSLFADMTYEGARSVIGPYLATLGASGFVVGVIAGGGELIGYALRFVSGRLADKTARYWGLTLLGYFLNLVAVPLLAVTKTWPQAATLVVAERLGKGVRTPPRDAMLSFATKLTGRGFGFGLHEGLDQSGALVGPLLVSLLLFLHWSYRESFLFLLIPALLSWATLLFARSLYPAPRDMEPATKMDGGGFSRQYWLFIVGAALLGFGFIDFALIAYHFAQIRLFSMVDIPLIYALAMGVSSLMAIFTGRLFDRWRRIALAFAVLSPLPFPLLVFVADVPGAIIGMVLWGVATGSQGVIMRAMVARLTPVDRRGLGYGFLYLFFGIFWFGGSALMGFLYGISIPALVVVSIIAELLALPFLFLSVRNTLNQ